MKQKPLFNIIVIICALGASVLACLSTTPKPPHYGVFFKQDEELIELQEQEIYDIPVEKQMGNAQTIPNLQPTIVIWRSQTNLDYIEFLKLNQYLGESKNSVNYNATPKENGIIEITPKSALADGIYCLIQGDPLAVFVSGWCFRIGSGSTSNIPAQPTVTVGVSSISTTIPDSALNQDAIIFRDRALQVLQKFDTAQYTFVRTEATEPNSPPTKWEGTSTQTSVHEIQYTINGDPFGEGIGVDNSNCIRTGGPWNCYSEPANTLFFQINNILTGKPLYGQSNQEIMGFGSSLESYNETPCRAFFVQYQGSGNGTVVELTKVCFDLENYYPIFMRIDDSYSKDGNLISQYSFVTSELKFNVPIDEIILPQQ